MDEKEISCVISIIKKFKKNFPPADNEAESFHLLSTTEIVNIVNEHAPKLCIDDIDIVKLLEDEGYKYEAVEEDGLIGMRWLVK